MAIPPQQNEAFFREVDEELRRAQMLGFFGRYGKLLALAVVLFLAAVGGALWWQHHQRTTAEKQGEEFAAVLVDLEAKKVQPNDPRLNKMLDEANDSYQTQARFLKAGLVAEKGNAAEAIALYRQIAADDDVAKVYRDAALVRQTALEYDKLNPGEVVERLKPLAVQGNAWFGTAGEMVGLAHIRQGKPQLAVPIFVAMAKDQQVPQSIRMRANEIAVSLGADPGPVSK